MDTNPLRAQYEEIGTCSALGLDESDKRNSGTPPRVVSLLATILERAIEKNEKHQVGLGRKDFVTIFHGSRLPSMSIRKYLERIFRYSKCSSSCYVLAFVYMRRFLQQTNTNLTKLNVHRLVITSVMLAAKFWDDDCYNNAYYAKVGGLSTEEMNRLEMKFLFGLDFKLHVTYEEFWNYCSKLENQHAGDFPNWPTHPIAISSGPGKGDGKKSTGTI